jgi:hypothetical protein
MAAHGPWCAANGLFKPWVESDAREIEIRSQAERRHAARKAAQRKALRAVGLFAGLKACASTEVHDTVPTRKRARLGKPLLNVRFGDS